MRDEKTVPKLFHLYIFKLIIQCCLELKCWIWGYLWRNLSRIEEEVVQWIMKVFWYSDVFQSCFLMVLTRMSSPLEFRLFEEDQKKNENLIQNFFRPSFISNSVISSLMFQEKLHYFLIRELKLLGICWYFLYDS